MHFTILWTQILILSGLFFWTDDRKNTYVQTDKQQKKYIYRLPVLSISGSFVQWMKHYLPASVACI